MYNITELNNKFTVTENNSSVQCTIPIGYYNINELLESMTNVLNTNSKHQHEYKITRNKTTNKIYIQSTKNFNLYFNTKKEDPYTLQSLLGFNKNEYLNNNMYVSETQPLEDIFNEVFLKVFCNNKEVTKYFTSNTPFSYFHLFHINYDDNFGKNYYYVPQQQDYFECSDEITTENISFEIWHSPEKPYTRHLLFDVVLSFESNVMQL
jgi:hypothetical protein